MTIAASILHHAATRPDAPAIIEPGRTTRYADLAEAVFRTAAHLRALGLAHGDRVGICLADTTDHLIVVLAAAHMGAVVAQLDWRASAAENRAFADALGLSLVVAEPEVVLDTPCPSVALDGVWRTAIDRVQATQDRQVDWDDDFLISATSGSTGLPRFTVMTHAQYYFATAGQLELMELSGRHRFLCTMPLYYAGSRANYLMYLIRGDCVVLYPSLVSASEYIDLVGSLGITIATVVPRFIRELLSAAGEQPILSQLSLFATVGAPLHAEEKLLALRKLTPNFIDHYGTSETLTISMLMPADLPERPASVGRPHSLIRVQTVDDEVRPTGPGEPGRLRIRGPGMARPLSGAAEASFQDGWFYPGEIARIDERGFIFIQGRTSEVIFRGGAKIYPAEVEAALLEHPDVVDAAVVGRAVEGEDARVIAFVIPRGDIAVGRLIAHCRTRLSPHKVPQEFRLCAEFPRNTSGKTDKLALARSLT